MILKSTFHFRKPRRWEVVAFRHPERASEVVVKRVVGLPGELIQIRDGEIYVDGQLARKSPAEQRAVAVLVHDADFTPNDVDATVPRWRGQKSNTRWNSNRGRFTHPTHDDSDSVDWLVYHHQRRLTAGKGHRESPVLNTRGYNQTRPLRSENTHPIADLTLSFRWVRAFGDGMLVLRANDGREEFHVRLDPNVRRFEVFRSTEPLGKQNSGPMPELGEGLDVDLSLVDRQFVLSFDGQDAIIEPYQPLTESAKPTATPLAVGVQGLSVEIHCLRVSRDIYYSRPVGTQKQWGLDSPYRLGVGQYFVLGDNSQVSSDSRIWQNGPVVEQDMLYGKPFLVHYPARRVGWIGHEFQVPDIEEIRYIR